MLASLHFLTRANSQLIQGRVGDIFAENGCALVPPTPCPSLSDLTLSFEQTKFLQCPERCKV